jgi:hypothetical protein
MTIRVSYRQEAGPGVRRWTDTVDPTHLDLERLEREAAEQGVTICQVVIVEPKGITLLPTVQVRARRFAQPEGWAA